MVCVWVIVCHRTQWRSEDNLQKWIFSTIHVLEIELRSSGLTQAPSLREPSCRLMNTREAVQSGRRNWTCSGWPARSKLCTCELLHLEHGAEARTSRGFGGQLGQCCIEPLAWHIVGVKCVWLSPWAERDVEEAPLTGEWWWSVSLCCWLTVTGRVSIYNLVSKKWQSSLWQFPEYAHIFSAYSYPSPRLPSSHPLLLVLPLLCFLLSCHTNSREWKNLSIIGIKIWKYSFLL